MSDEKNLGERGATCAKAHPETDEAPAPLRILVVDDFHDAAETMALILRSFGHDARGVNSGAEAVRLAEEFCPDVAFIDLSMPGMDGCAVARHLRRLPGLEKTLLVCVSVFDGEADHRRSGEAGFDYHLPKPVDPDDLEVLLQVWITKARRGTDA